MTCKNCGENMEGDGYTLVRHCPNSEGAGDREPDADPLYCAPLGVKIYGFFNWKIPYGNADGISLSETGEIVTTHVCRSEAHAMRALNRPDVFDAKYPDGWTFEFVSILERDTHVGFQRALEAFDKRTKGETK
jgi:hypothetical protein